MAQVLSKEVSPKIYSAKENSSLMPYRTLSYLSLCWAFGLVTEMLLPMALGATVFFAGPDVLQVGRLIVLVISMKLALSSHDFWGQLRKFVKSLNTLMSFLVAKISQLLSSS